MISNFRTNFLHQLPVEISLGIVQIRWELSKRWADNSLANNKLEAFYLYHVENKTLKEIGKIFGRSQSTVQVWVRHVGWKLKQTRLKACKEDIRGILKQLETIEDV